MTGDGVEAPVAPVLRGRSATRERARIAAVGAIAVALLAAGIGVAGNGFELGPPASASPNAGTHLASPAPTPSASNRPTTAPPTSGVGKDCQALIQGSTPTVRLGARGGSVLAIAGTAADPSAGVDPRDPDTWPRPAIGGAVLAGGGVIEVTADGSYDLPTCIRSIIADVAPADPGLAGPFPMALRELTLPQPGPSMEVGSLPSGDWVVRVETSFWAGLERESEIVASERYFRVIAGSGQGPLPTPEITPMVPCTPRSAGADPPELILTGASVGPIRGDAVGQSVPVQLGEPIEVRVEGDACARGWRLAATLPDPGGSIDIDVVDNPGASPFRYAQNRWPLHDLQTGAVIVTATVRFSADLVVGARWQLEITAPDFPAATISAPGHGPVGAFPGCGVWWSFPVGLSGYSQCTATEVPATLDFLIVPAETPVSLEVPGWTITSWSGQCGILEGSADPSDPLFIVDGCDLGGLGVPGPVVFLPRPDATAVRIWVTVERDGVVASGSYYALVSTTPAR